LSRKKLTNDEAHRLRIKIKRLRYALEAVGQTPRSLNTLQDSLGRAHDLVILQTLTKRNPQIQNQISREYSRALKKLKAYFFVLAFERAAAKAPPKAPPIEALV
jgi:CHAD domain-containing protein